MASAKELRDELIAQHATAAPHGPGAARRVALEAVADRLFDRLLEHPEELDAFEDAVWENLQEQRHAGLGVRRALADFRQNNVTLDWPARRETWQWPPRLFVAYDAMIAEELPGVRVLGECWGMSKICHPARGGGVLLTGDPSSALGPRVRWASTWDRVECLLGATWREVNGFLDAKPKTHDLANQPGFDGLTVAGSVGVGGHGSALGLGPLSSMVQRVTLGAVTPGRSTTEFTRSDPEFDYVATHLGRLGAVVAMELDVRDAYQIAEERQIRVLGKHGTWQAGLRALIDEAVGLQGEPDVHSTDIWIAPYVDDGELVTAFGIRRRTRGEVPSHATRPAVLRSEALQALGRFLATIVAALHPRLIRGVLRRTVRATQTPRVVMAAREGLDFGAPNVNRMGAIEMAFDISTSVDVAPIVSAIETLEHLAQTNRRYVFSPMGVRFVGAGPARGLSPHVGRARTMHLEIPTFGDENTFHGDEVLEPLQRVLATRHQGRPHWGQRIYLTATELNALWPATEVAAMKSLVERLDPDKVFANELLDELLGIT